MANVHRRVRTKSNICNDIQINLSSLYDSNKKLNATLIELPARDYEHLKGNSIHISGIKKTQDGKGIIYHNINYGKSISINKKSVNIGVNKKYRHINLEKTKGKLLLITADKLECLSYNPNTYIIVSNMTYNHNIDGISSGKVILIMGILNSNEDTAISSNIWDNEIHNLVKSCKVNSLDSYDHHGSKGFVYSFGNKNCMVIKTNHLFQFMPIKRVKVRVGNFK